MVSKSFELKLPLVVVVVGVVGLIAYRTHLFTPASAYNVTGQVVEVSVADSTVKINLVYVFKDGTTAPVDGTQNEVTVHTNTNTKFVGTILQRPSKEELAKTKGGWDMNTVKKEVVSGELSDISKGSSISVKTSTNNPWGGSFTASEVDYYSIAD